MKRATFDRGDGPRTGIVIDDRIVDVAAGGGMTDLIGSFEQRRATPPTRAIEARMQAEG